MNYKLASFLLLSYTLAFVHAAPTIRDNAGESCNSDAACEGDFVCRTLNDGKIESCTPGDECICAPPGISEIPKICQDNGDCDDNGECFSFGDDGVCFDSLIDLLEEAGVCIAVHHLNDFDKDELVFGDHRRTNVLCDRNDNCATGGHIVVWNGKGMMMRSYCDVIGGCTTKSALVNSPKWRKGLRVRGNGEGLEFAALAARYETRAEEVVMDMAVRMGM